MSFAGSHEAMCEYAHAHLERVLSFTQPCLINPLFLFPGKKLTYSGQMGQMGHSGLTLVQSTGSTPLDLPLIYAMLGVAARVYLARLSISARRVAQDHVVAPFNWHGWQDIGVCCVRQQYVWLMPEDLTHVVSRVLPTFPHRSASQRTHAGHAVSTLTSSSDVS